MKKCFTIAFLFITLQAGASHIVGGEFQRIHLGGYQYRFNLILFFDEINNGFGGVPIEQMEPMLTARIFSNSANAFVRDVTLTFLSKAPVGYSNSGCGASFLSVSRAVYSVMVTLAPEQFNDPLGYYIAWERCCRNYTITNIYSDPPTQGVSPMSAGQTFFMEFPPVIRNNEPFINSSPQFATAFSDYACPGRMFAVELSGIDPDGDSLVYSLTTPFSTHETVAIPQIAPKPYPEVGWRAPFSAQNIMNGSPDLSITKAGVLTVRTTTLGLFVYAIKLEEFRGGVKIGEVRREYQIFVVDACEPATAPEISVRTSSGTFVESPLDIEFTGAETDAERCILVNVKKTDDAFIYGGQEHVRIKAISLDFPLDLANILPSVTMATLTATSPSAEFSLCFDRCPPTNRANFRIGIVAFDESCSVPLSDTIRVNIHMPLSNCSSQTISFPAIPDKTIGDPPFSLNATATSGLPVSFISSHTNRASVASGVVTLHEAGRVTIMASQTGGEVYAPASPASRQFCVNPIAPVISLQHQEEKSILISTGEMEILWFKNGVLLETGYENVIEFQNEIGLYTARALVNNCISEESNSIVITGAGESSTHEISVFPNPATNAITIRMTGANRLRNIEMVDIFGEVVIGENTAQEFHTIDISEWSAGFYLIKVSDGEKVQVMKLVKR
jgi:hypothetical protein